MEKSHSQYNHYMLKGVALSVGPLNMNAVGERFVGSVWREALDDFIIINSENSGSIQATPSLFQDGSIADIIFPLHG
jgi:hypothetical protein